MAMRLLFSLTRRPTRLNSIVRFAGCRRQASIVSQTQIKPKICVVGSGPAGFYTAQGLLKGIPDVSVDIYDKLPVPYGLIRYGVAPDHPEVKNIINTFVKTTKSDGFRFFGNVNIGADVSLEQLKAAYHAVVFCTGAEIDKRLEIPGESLLNVLSARNFVGWFNGLPEDSKLKVNLDVETVAIFGQGNVAVDVARMLLTKIDILKKTDITQYALDALSKSRVRKVLLIGRRGPLQVAFTIKELRELLNMDDCKGVILEQNMSNIDTSTIEERPRQRITDLMLKNAVPSNHVDHLGLKRWELMFHRSPLEFLASDNKNLSGVRLGINKLEGSSKNPKAIATGESEILECQLAFKSIGFRSGVVDQSLPYDSNMGVLKNIKGRIVDNQGLYCGGWAALGPVGVVVTTRNDSLLLCRTISDDIKEGLLDVGEPKCGGEDILRLLKNKNVQVVTFNDWLKIDQEEQSRGTKVGKPREKIVDVNEMLRLARE